MAVFFLVFFCNLPNQKSGVSLKRGAEASRHATLLFDSDSSYIVQLSQHSLFIVLVDCFPLLMGFKL